MESHQWKEGKSYKKCRIATRAINCIIFRSWHYISILRLPCYPVATLQQIAWVTLSWGREGSLTSWGAFVPVDFSKDKGVTRDLSVFWSYTRSAFWIGPLKYFKNNERLKDAISCSMAEKKGGRGTRIIGECWHNNVRRDIMVIIATCPQWCRSKIKWDAERTQSAVRRCILRAKTVYCRCSLRSLFYIKTEVGVEWNSTSLLVVFAFCEDEIGTDWNENYVWGWQIYHCQSFFPNILAIWMDGQTLY